MRKILLIAAGLLISIFGGFGQVQIKPMPKSGYEKRIREYVDNMKVADTHEHFCNISNKDNALDFMLLLRHYPYLDLISAGMQQQEFDKIAWSNELTIIEKWQVIKPYWEATSNTAYCRSALLAADQLFGIKNIDSSTVELLSEKIRKAYQNPEVWVNHVLKEKCNIEFAIQCAGGHKWGEEDDRSYCDPKIFRHVQFFDGMFKIFSKKDLEEFSQWKKSGINTLDDLEDAVKVKFSQEMDKGDVAIKFACAYWRTLAFDEVKKENAAEVFNEIMSSSGSLSFEEVKPLQDYVALRILELANMNHIPVQIHTGLQASNDNIIENSKPTHLINLFQKFPQVRFILFHGSYPYGGELSTLAKNFPNVYIDMCWDYIISPSYSERYLHEWLETVPASKIMAFGGDDNNVENIYSHLLLAKQVISNVLVAKVRDGYFTEAEALKIAQMILHDNAVSILNLK